MNDLNNINLEIDGLTYEKLHYLREIQCCQSYQPIDKDCEFLKVPIKKLSTDDDSLPSETDDTEVPDTEKAHQLTIKLLESELEQRRALLIELDKILPPRKSLWLQKIKTRNNECDKLFKKLEQLRGQVSQLQTDCNISLVKQVQTHRLSRYLPLPLYSIYIQLTSWVQLQDEKALTVNILGDKTNAQQINGSWESKGLKALRELSIADLHKSHSLSLLLRLVWPTSGNPINVRIEYLVHLHIVTAIVEMAEDPYLLALLYPDDSGEFSPNFSNCYIHDEKKPFQILKSKGRAFRWLQFIAGLYFVHPLPAVTPIEISPDLKKSTDTSSGVMALDFQGTSDYSLTQIMSRLFKRLKVRETLNSHISLFKSGKIPIESNIKPNVPNTSWLHRWEDQSYLQAKELIKTIEAKMKLNEHSDFEESPPISVPVGTTVCVVTPPEFVAVHPNSIELSSRFFKIIFATSDTKEKICGLVQVFADYPSRIPVFLFYLETTNEISKSSIQEILKIQSAINTLESEDEALEESQILAYQVSKLQICLDIKCDLDKQKEKSIFANIEERYTKQFWKSLC
ncbi:uncharacterized protein LOC126319995 [Schistocerca gregaria]|uniref:uncharacterized protein LOC126319995 n=1 Tax=Schistocerca gregaria TaxID=7010 RepID=UPI00211E901D|nr:uncharacterized protein LOC126319995 [Schistocerca gregaria]